MGSDTAGDPVTVVVTRRPLPGCEDALHLWALGMIEQAKTFPGHRGAQVFPPIPGAQPDQVLAFTFASRADLDRWQDSDVRRQWLAKAAGLTEARTTRHVLSGLEGLFGAQDRTPVVPPPKWKTAATVWTAVFPLTLLLNWLLVPALSGLVLPLRTLVTTLLLAPLMVYLGVPFVSRVLLKSWLARN